MDISKSISEFLREKYSVRASHGRELAAAFLGYKSHAAYLSDADSRNYRLDAIEALIPDVAGLETRLRKIADLPAMPSGKELAEAIGEDLKATKTFRGDVLVAKDLAEFESLMWSYLPEYVSLEDELSHVMALTNANGFMEYYDTVNASIEGNALVVEASGTFTGKNDDERDKPNHGEVIDFNVSLRFELKAWRSGCVRNIAADGEVRSPY